MNTRSRCVVAMLLACLLSAPALLSQGASALFEQGLLKENAEGTLNDAIAIFSRIAGDTTADAAIRAKAQLHVGICHEKLGDAQARGAYERLIADFPEQTSEVTAARARLAMLKAPRSQPSIGKGDGGLRIRSVPELKPGGLSRDGRWIARVDDDGNLAVVAVGTGAKRVLTHSASWDDGEFADLARISPDSTRVAYSWFGKLTGCDLRVVNIDGTGERTLVSGDRDGPSAQTEIWPFDWTAGGRFIVAAVAPGFRNPGRFSSRLVRVSVSDGTIDLIKDLRAPRPTELEVSPDGRWIAYELIVNPDRDKTRDVFLLSLDGKSQANLTAHPADDRLLGWTPDGDHVLFASNRSGTSDAWVVPVEAGRASGEPVLVKRDFGPGLPMGITPQGSLYYAIRQQLADVYTAALDPENGRILSPPRKVVQSFEGNNVYPAWSPDGKHLAYIRRVSPTPNSEADLCLLSVDTGDCREIHPKLGSMGRMSWLPDGEHVLVVYRGIHSVNVKTAAVRTLVTAGLGFHSPRCTPDGRSILYEDDSREESGEFRVMSHDVDSGKAKEVYRSSQQIIRMDISPDGRWVAFLEPADAALKIMPPQGGQPRVLHRFDLDKGVFSTSVAWSPDGKYVYFTKGGGGQQGSFDLWRIPSAGGEALRLDVAAPGMENLDVHPDGRRIAFNSTEVRREVWVMENFLPAVGRK